jgi:broad specificity phosphatase PhoE
MTILLLFLSLSAVLAQVKLFIGISFHGSRSPHVLQPWDTSSNWPYGPSQLTPEGIRQAFLVGKSLYHKFANNSNLLSKGYNPTQLEIYSSKSDRTMQNAKSIACGLYEMESSILNELPNIPLEETNEEINLPKPLREDVIPVFLSETSIEPLLLPLSDCEEYLEHYERRKYSSAIREIYKDYSTVIDPIINHFKYSRKDAEDRFVDVFDSVKCNLFINSSPPSPFDENWVLKAEQLYLALVKFRLYSPDFLARFSGSQLLNEVLKKFDRVVLKQQVSRGIIYSSTEFTLLNILSALNFQVTESPPFSSLLLFELHYFDNMYQVRILYNNQELVLPGHTKFISLEDFRAYLKIRTFPDADSACMDINTVTAEDDYEVEDSEFARLLVIDGLLMMAAIACIKFLMNKIPR